MYKVSVFEWPRGPLVASLDEPKPRFDVHAYTMDELQAELRAAFTRMMEREKPPINSLEITRKRDQQPPTSALYIEAAVG
jgi:hypothetical protein